MKNKALMGLIAAVTIGSAAATPTIMNNENTTHAINKILMTNNNAGNSVTNEAVVINGNSNMNLYALSNGSGIISKLSTGEMLTILGQSQKGYCKVKVQETGDVGYIKTANMQSILNGTNATLATLSESGQVVNVSSNVRLRVNPSINANIIGHLTNGTSLNILGKQGQWYKVSVNGQTGFIYGEYVSTNGSNAVNSNSQSSATSNSSSQGSTSGLSSNNINSNSSSSNTVANSSSSQANNSTSSSNASSVSSNSSTSSGTTSSSKVNSASGTDSSNHVKNVIVRSKNSGTTSSITNSKSGNISSEGYTYATSSEINNISGIYNMNNFANGRSPKSLQDLTGITINSNGIVLTNYITGNNLYESSARMKVYKFTSNDFTSTFGVTPSSLGLQGNSFNVYAIGSVFVYQLPNKNIVFSFENGAGNAINTTNNIATSNVSKWYGTYTVGNKVGQVDGVNNYNQSAINITGQKVVIESNEFKYENKTIKNPQYYIIKVSPSALFGTSYSGADLTGANSVDILAVLGPGEKMSNNLYNALPSYTGCMSGAWAAGIAMPIILGPNGNIQVMNNNDEIYSGIKDAQSSKTTNSGAGSSQNSKSQSGITSRTKSSGTSQVNNNSNSANSQNILRKENNNKLSNYLGKWEVSKNGGHSIEGMTENAPSLIGSKLEMTNDTYSFDGVTINNPYYYVQSVSARDLFGQDGATGVLGNQENLDRLIVSSKPLTASEVKNITLNGLNSTIILNNSNIYVFGGGKNHAQIDSVTQPSSTVNGTNSSNSGNTQHAPGAGAHVNNMNNGSPTPVSSSNSQINSNNSKESYATFSLATINKNCSLYDATPDLSGGPSLKLSKGGTVFILNNNSNYPVQKGWVFARTAMGAGYLPLTDFNITNNTKYNVKVLSKDCNLYADTNIHTNTGLQIYPGEQVFVPVNEPSSSKWVPVICAKTLITFESGFLPSNVLESTSKITQPLNS